MKIFGTILILISLLMIGLQIGCDIHANYEYKNQYESYWNLAEKASTISQKSEYIDKFVNALSSDKSLQGTYNAISLKTQDNSFDANLTALKSLQQRLHQIDTMNISSFEYQTAIQQITAQEQGEAGPMLDVFYGCWYLHYHRLLWNWISALIWITGILMFVAGLACFALMTI